MTQTMVRPRLQAGFRLQGKTMRASGTAFRWNSILQLMGPTAACHQVYFEVTQPVLHAALRMESFAI